jgi:hypothetical protein
MWIFVRARVKASSPALNCRRPIQAVLEHRASLRQALLWVLGTRRASESEGTALAISPQPSASPEDHGSRSVQIGDLTIAPLLDYAITLDCARRHATARVHTTVACDTNCFRVRKLVAVAMPNQ